MTSFATKINECISTLAIIPAPQYRIGEYNYIVLYNKQLHPSHFQWIRLSVDRMFGSGRVVGSPVEVELRECERGKQIRSRHLDRVVGHVDLNCKTFHPLIKHVSKSFKENGPSPMIVRILSQAPSFILFFFYKYLIPLCI